MKKMIIMLLCLLLVGCTNQSNNSTTTMTTTTTPVVTEKPKSTSEILFEERDALNCEFEVTPNGEIYKVKGTCENKLDEEIHVVSMHLVGKDELLFDYNVTKGFTVKPKSSYEWNFDSYKFKDSYGGLVLYEYSYVNAAKDTIFHIDERGETSLKGNYTEKKEEENKTNPDFIKYNVFEFVVSEADVDYDTVQTIFEISIENLVDYDLYLNDIWFNSDSLSGLDLLIPANSTVTKYFSLFTDKNAVDPLVESDKEETSFLESYTYYTEGKDYSVDVIDKNVYVSEHSDYTYSEEGLSYARRMNNGFTIYAWQENGEWYFDYLEGREYEKEDLSYAGMQSANTIYDFALSTFNGFEEDILYNFVDSDIVIDGDVKTYIETAVTELGLNVVYNNDYSNVNLDDYRSVDTIALHVSESISDLYLVYTYLQNPYKFTEEEKSKVGSNVYTKEGIVELVNNQVLNQNVYICGKETPLTSEQKTELITYFEKNHVYASYEGEKEVYVFKPVIYIYGEENTNVHVEVDGDLCISYPLYEDGWDVTIQDGKLVSDDRNYEYLYYEANVEDVFRRDIGFVVAREDSITFLEEKLAILGLNEREMNDMITFWLPYLYQKPYNFISFQSETYSELVPLTVSPIPDTMIRIYMLIDGLEEYKEVQKQELVPVTRSGYTVVEWGGSYLE